MTDDEPDASGIPAATALAATALAASPAGLVTDLDGTLAPIAAHPREVHLVPGVIEDLTALADRLSVVAVVTGRAAIDARHLLGRRLGASVVVIGNHGLEWLEPGADRPDAAPHLEEARTAVRQALAALAEAPGSGVWIEDKGISATIHVRAARDPEAAAGDVVRRLERVIDRRLALRRGRMAVELRPLGAGDKGTAVDGIVARYRLRGLVVAGDDVTDLDMFRAARSLRAEGRLRAAVIGVRGGAEVPDQVAAAADIVLPSPSAMGLLLASLSSKLAGGSARGD